MNLMNESPSEKQDRLLFTKHDNRSSHGNGFKNREQGRENSSQGNWRDEKDRETRRNISYDNFRNKDRDDRDWRKKHSRDQNRFKKDLRDIECYNCHKFGHIARNCLEKDKGKEEEMNIVEEDNEPTLLMETMADKDEQENASLEEEPSWKGIIIKKNEIPNEKLEDIRSEIETDLKNKLELWKFEMLHDFEEKRQELEADFKNRELEFERKTHERESSFEYKMRNEMASVECLKEIQNEVVNSLGFPRESDIKFRELYAMYLEALDSYCENAKEIPSLVHKPKQEVLLKAKEVENSREAMKTRIPPRFEGMEVTAGLRRGYQEGREADGFSAIRKGPAWQWKSTKERRHGMIEEASTSDQ